MEKHKNKKQQVRVRNKEFQVIAYLFLGLFLAMIAYFVYFQVYKSESFYQQPV